MLEAQRIHAQGSESAGRTLSEADADKLDALRGLSLGEILAALKHLPAARVAEFNSALAASRPDAAGTGAWPGMADELAAGSAPAPGKTLGRYELRSELGRGGMGVVYLAYDTQLKREVALKLLLAGDAASYDQLVRFHREAQAAAQLTHPNVAATFDVGIEDGKHYITIEFLRGGTLGERLEKQGRLPVSQALPIMQAVAEAVAHAHAHGIVHRDLKPENVLFDEGGRPKVSDFGLARIVTDDGSRRTASGSVLGTPHYMSPEQAAGQTADHRSDVYSLGAILYELLTGSTPYRNGPPMEVVLAKLREDAPSPRSLLPTLSPEIETIIAKAMERDLDRRYPSALTFAEDLRRFQAGEAILARPDDLAYRLRKWVRRHRVVVAATALLLVAAGLVTWFARQGSVERHATRQAEGEVINSLRRLANLAYAAAGSEFGAESRSPLRLEFEAACDRVRTQTPDAAEPYHLLARLRALQMRFRDASALMAEAVARDPESYDTRFQDVSLRCQMLEADFALARRQWLIAEHMRRSERELLGAAGDAVCPDRRPPTFAQWVGATPGARERLDRVIQDLTSLAGERDPAMSRLRRNQQQPVVRGLLQLYQSAAAGNSIAPVPGLWSPPAHDPGTDPPQTWAVGEANPGLWVADIAAERAKADLLVPGQSLDNPTVDARPLSKAGYRYLQRADARWLSALNATKQPRDFITAAWHDYRQMWEREYREPSVGLALLVLQAAALRFPPIPEDAISRDKYAVPDAGDMSSIWLQAERVLRDDADLPRALAYRSAVLNTRAGILYDADPRNCLTRLGPADPSLAIWRGHLLRLCARQAAEKGLEEATTGFVRDAADNFLAAAETGKQAPETLLRLVCLHCDVAAAWGARSDQSDPLFRLASEEADALVRVHPPIKGALTLRSSVLVRWCQARQGSGADTKELEALALAELAKSTAEEADRAQDPLDEARFQLAVADAATARGEDAREAYRRVEALVAKIPRRGGVPLASLLLSAAARRRHGECELALGRDPLPDGRAAHEYLSRVRPSEVRTEALELECTAVDLLMAAGCVNARQSASEWVTSLKKAEPLIRKRTEFQVPYARLLSRMMLLPGVDSQRRKDLYQEARAWFELALAAFPNRGDLRVESGDLECDFAELPIEFGASSAQRRARDLPLYDAAMKHYEAALSRPDAPKWEANRGMTRACLGQAYRWFGDFSVHARAAKARGFAETCVELAPDRGESHWWLAVALSAEEAWAPAVKEFEIAAGMDPKSVPYYQSAWNFAVWNAAGADPGTIPAASRATTTLGLARVDSTMPTTIRVVPKDLEGELQVIAGRSTECQGSNGAIQWNPTNFDDAGRKDMRLQALSGGRLWNFPLMLYVDATRASRTAGPTRPTSSDAAPTTPEDRGSTQPAEELAALRFSGGRSGLVPAPQDGSAAVLCAQTLSFLSPDGSAVTRTLTLPKAYRKVALRSEVLVAIDVATLDLLDPATGKLQRSIPLPAKGTLDLALDPKQPISWVALIDADATAVAEPLRWRLARVDEKTGKVTRFPEAIGNCVAVHPSGKRVFTGLHYLCRDRATLLTSVGAIEVAQETDLDVLFAFEVRPEGLRRLGANIGAGWNGFRVRLSPDGRHVSYVAGGGYRTGPEKFQGYTIPAFPVDDISTPVTAYPLGIYPADIAYHPVFPWVAAASVEQVFLFERETGVPLGGDRLPRVKYSTRNQIRAVQFSADGCHLMVLSGRSDEPGVLHSLKLRLEPAEAAKAGNQAIVTAPRETAGNTGVEVERRALDALAEPAASARRETREIARDFLDAVVVIETGQGTATGFFVGAGGYVLTCGHAIPARGDVNVRYRPPSAPKDSAGTVARAAVIALDVELDLALLKIPTAGNAVRVVRLANTRPELGEKIVIIGNPGMAQQVLERTLTTGVVSSPNRTIDGHSYVQTDAGVNPGTSGSPMFDESGNVAGLVVLKAALEGVGFGVPAESLRAFLEANSRPATGK